MRKAVVFTLVITFLCVACQKGVVDTRPVDPYNNPLRSHIDSVVHQFYQQYKASMNAVSISIGILENGQMHTYGYGETIIGNGQTPNENTFYEIGSISKVFTSLAASIWLQEQNLTLRTGIRNYQPASIPLLAKNGIAINFENLMTHTAGFERDPTDILSSPNMPAAYAAYDSNKLYNYVRNNPLVSTPGSVYDYSNIGFGMLGCILGRQFNRTYEEIVRSKITDEIGMTHTKVFLTNADKANAAKPYLGRVLQPDLLFTGFSGAGALKSTTGDLLKFAKAYVNNLASLKLANAMRACAQVHFSGMDASGMALESGLAWSFFALSSTNTHVLEHSGATFGHSSVLLINEQSKKAFVLLVTMPANQTEETALQNFASELILRFLD
jgi:CubicO group peptidase (beta-lactamase class C family)